MGVSISVMCVKNEDYRRRSEQVSENAESEKERVREKEKETRPPKKRPSMSTNLHWFQISDCIFAIAKIFHFST